MSAEPRQDLGEAPGSGESTPLSKAGKIIPEVTVVITARLVGGIWDTDVVLDGEVVGGGTSPHGFLDTAADILYGDTNDWLNGSHGVLGDALTRSEAPGRGATPKDSGGGR